MVSDRLRNGQILEEPRRPAAWRGVAARPSARPKCEIETLVEDMTSRSERLAEDFRRSRTAHSRRRRRLGELAMALTVVAAVLAWVVS